MHSKDVLDVLRQAGAALVGYVAGLSDAELDRTGLWLFWAAP
jgi:hypothetical protein